MKRMPPYPLAEEEQARISKNVEDSVLESFGPWDLCLPVARVSAEGAGARRRPVARPVLLPSACSPTFLLNYWELE